MSAKNKAAAAGDNEEANKSSASDSVDKEDELYMSKRPWLEQQIDEEGEPKHFWNLEPRTWIPEYAKNELYSFPKAVQEEYELMDVEHEDAKKKILDLARGCPQSRRFLGRCFEKAIEFKCYTVAEGILRVWLHQIDPFDKEMIKQRSGIIRTFSGDRKMSLLEFVDELDQRIFLKIHRLYETYSEKRPTSRQITEALIEAAKKEVEEKRREREYTATEIYNSLAIEGGRLTLKEVTKVTEGEVKSLPGKSQAEIEDVIGMKEAIEYLNELRKSKVNMELEHLRQVHRHVMKGRAEMDPGNFRTVHVHIEGVPFVPCHHTEVEAEMGKVFDFMHNKPEGMHPIEYAALLHYIFVYVHPFRDGNGRVGRLLLNFALQSMDYPPIIVPVDHRLEYMDCICFANMGDARRLIRYFVEIVEETFNNWIEKGNFSTSKWDSPSGANDATMAEKAGESAEHQQRHLDSIPQPSSSSSN